MSPTIYKRLEDFSKKIITMADEDPTSLNNILNALRNSKRLKHWDKPPKDFGPENPEDSEYNRNGLKDVGDLSRITISPGFSFGINDEVEEEHTPGTVEDDSTTNILQDIMDSDEELHQEIRCDSLDIARTARQQYRLALRLEEMSLEEEYKQAVWKRSKAHHAAYLKKLSEIRENYDEKMMQYYLERDEKLALEEGRLRKQNEDIIQAVKQCENEYRQYATKRSSQLLEVVEDTRRKENELADRRRAFVNQLHSAKASYITKLTQMRQLLGEFEDSETLDSQTEGFLNETISHVEDILNSANENTTTQKQLDEAQNSLQEGLNCIDAITQTLNVKKAEKAKLEAEKAEKAAAQLEMEKQEAAKKEQEKLVNEQRQEGGYDVLVMIAGKKRLEELEKKVENYLNVQEKVSQAKRLEMNRAASIVNQLNLTDNRINREKLQKLLSLLAGRTVDPGRVSTNNDPILTDYVKSLVTSNIVKLGHDKQGAAAAAAAYSWLLVNIVSVHPGMWDLFLYHVFNTCPYLVPLYPVQEDGQSEEDFNKAKGIRNNEKIDSYIGRMGNCAMMYGLVLAMISKRQGFPVQAPVVGWELLARLVSLPPSSGVTAAILHNFLNTAGACLQQAYGRQFLKLMDYMNSVYIVKIKEITADAGTQALTVLQNFMEDFNTTRKLRENELISKFN